MHRRGSAGPQHDGPASPDPLPRSHATISPGAWISAGDTHQDGGKGHIAVGADKGYDVVQAKGSKGYGIIMADGGKECDAVHADGNKGYSGVLADGGKG